MNGSGFGKATINVTTSDDNSKTLTTPNTNGPSASMAHNTNFFFGTSLPSGSSRATVSQIKGLPGYIWQANTVGSDGDSTDNPELEARVTIVAADCAALEMTSSAVIAPGDKSGIITVNAKATFGTALWLRGYEIVGGQVPPTDDPDTPVDEFKEFVKAMGSLKWDVLLTGPFDLSETNCTAMNVPFTVETSTTNLYFITDAVAKSLPLLIVCPTNMMVDCAEPVVYAPVQVAGCGDITVTFNPPVGTAFPVGVTPVTVTATDKDGNTNSCTFTVTVTDTQAPVPPVLATVTGSCASPVTLSAPTATDNCAGTVTGTTTTTFPITTVGTNVVTWTFNDGHGNTSIANQTVIIPGLTFHGFYSPIGGTDGSCGSPLRTANLGNNLPVKFDVECAGSRVVTGTPMLSIEKSDASCTSLTPVGGGNFTLVGNEWHFNWATGSGGTTKGTYKLTATLQDGTKRFVWIKLK
jgi:hypothetical protein